MAILFAGVAFAACGVDGLNDDLEDLEASMQHTNGTLDEIIATLSQGLTIGAVQGGFQGTGIDHLQCPYTTGSSCSFPAMPPNGFGAEHDHNTKDLTTGWPAGFGQATAREAADSAWSAVSDHEYFPSSCASGGLDCISFYFENNENISGVVTQSDQFLSKFYRVSCLQATNLVEQDFTQGMNVSLCNRWKVQIDVGSFSAWVNGWPGITTAKKQQAQNALYGHLYGLMSGAGATDNVGTMMRRTMVRNSPTMTIQQYQGCMINDLHPNANPGFSSVLVNQTTCTD